MENRLNKLISIVVPVYNEEDNINELVSRTQKIFKDENFNYEMIFIDDGSKDNSFFQLKKQAELDKNIKIVRFSRNFGHQAAITAGIDFAKGDAIIVMDADLQDPPEVIPRFIEKWEEGFDVVYGKRKKRKGESFLKLLTASAYYRILRFLTDTDIPRDVGDFRLISRKVADDFRAIREKNRYIRGLISWIGFKQTEVLYERQERCKGKTKFTWPKMIRFALDGIVSFSRAPLKLATYFGFLVSFISFIKIIELVYYKMKGQYVPGWASIMVAILFIGGVQLLTLGIVGAYIGRIYDEVKQRPLYITDEKIGFDKKDSHT